MFYMIFTVGLYLKWIKSAQIKSGQKKVKISQYYVLPHLIGKENFEMRCTGCNAKTNGVLFNKNEGLTIEANYVAVTKNHELNGKYCGIFKPVDDCSFQSIGHSYVGNLLKDRKCVPDNRRSKWKVSEKQKLDMEPVYREKRKYMVQFYESHIDLGIPPHFQSCLRCQKQKLMELFNLNIGISFLHVQVDTS